MASVGRVSIKPHLNIGYNNVGVDGGFFWRGVDIVHGQRGNVAVALIKLKPTIPIHTASNYTNPVFREPRTILLGRDSR